MRILHVGRLRCGPLFQELLYHSVRSLLLLLAAASSNVTSRSRHEPDLVATLSSSVDRLVHVHELVVDLLRDRLLPVHAGFDHLVDGGHSLRIQILLRLLGQDLLALLVDGLTTLVLLDVVLTLAQALRRSTLRLGVLNLTCMIQRRLHRRAVSLEADLRLATRLLLLLHILRAVPRRLLPRVLTLALDLKCLLDQQLLSIVDLHLMMLAILLRILRLHHAVH